MTMTMALLRPPLLPLLLLLLLSLIHTHNASLVSAKEQSPGTTLQCQSGWSRSSKLQTIPPNKINDGYCDCPLDGSDELETGACSGSMDGMWAGIPPSVSLHGGTSSSGGGVNTNMFVCPQQPSLHLPPSRINDGICDCCDGADESSTSCDDVCDTVLAAEREAHQKLQQDYLLGSQGRQSSIRQFQTYVEELQFKIQRVEGQDVVNLERSMQDSKVVLIERRKELVRKWAVAVGDVLGHSTLNEIVTNINQHDGSRSEHKLGLLIMSLCQLSGEASADQIVNGRCLPLDRASLDMGLLWGDDDDDGQLPSFQVFDAEMEDSIANYAEKLILRLEGKDARSDSTTTTTKSAAKKSSSSSSSNKGVKISHSEPDMEDDYDEEWHDYHDDEYIDDSGDYINEHDIEEEDHDNDGKNEGDNATMKFLLENLPLHAVRDAFKRHGRALLASPVTNDNEDTDAEEKEDPALEDDVSDNNVDPMALSMARSTISKRLGNIDRGETSARSAARFVAALIENGSSDLEKLLQNLAIMTIYYSKLSSEDIAEIIYTLTFPSDQRDDGLEQTCSDVTPWSTWCPPVTLVSQDGGKSYPPPIIVAAAERRCSQRDDAVGVCSGKKDGETDIEFPLSVPDGYYAYFEPQVRTPDDELWPFFAAMDSLRMPEDLINAKKTVEDVDTKLASTRRELTKLLEELRSSDASKYGVDGELFTMRDSCHKIESGKYEYEVCIFGKATQRDIGQKSGGTQLGSWEKVIMEDGHRTLKWDRGTKCWNGPVRSAEVSVTCGRSTKILSANEPDTCRYVFTMESPIACDEQFKMNNSL